MSEQPPKDLGPTLVLLVVVLVILLLGVIVLVYDRPPSTTVGARGRTDLYVRRRARFGGHFFELSGAPITGSSIPRQ